MTKYPAASGSKLNTCNLCHGSGGTSTFNPYGSAVGSAAGSSITAWLTAVEGSDSDGDGSTNLAEINALTFPGDPADKPASGGTPPPPPPPPADTTAPTVRSANPANNQSGVAVNASVTATFSEAVDPATVTSATFALRAGASAVAGTVSLSGMTATFRPSAALANGATYTATVTTGVRDAAGNALAANYVWTFVTAAAADTTPPAVSSVSPANNQAGVAANASVTATFSEAVNPATVTTASFTLRGGAAVVAGTVSLSGMTATFRPSASLAPGTAYTATITNAVRDAAGNALAAAYTWGFTTGAAPDTTPPAVSAVSPENNRTDVPVDASITATFSEPVNPATVTAETFNVSDGVGDVAGSVSANGTTVTFTPSAPLVEDTTYTVTLTTGIRDLAGNALPAVHSESFQTAATADPPAPPPASPPPAEPVSEIGGASGGGCSVARSGGGIGEIAGAYGLLILTAAGLALRRRVARKAE